MVDGLAMIRLEQDYDKARHAARRLAKAAHRESRADRDVRAELGRIKAIRRAMLRGQNNSETE